MCINEQKGLQELWQKKVSNTFHSEWKTKKFRAHSGMRMSLLKTTHPSMTLGRSQWRWVVRYLTQISEHTAKRHRASCPASPPRENRVKRTFSTLNKIMRKRKLNQERENMYACFGNALQSRTCQRDRGTQIQLDLCVCVCVWIII